MNVLKSRFSTTMTAACAIVIATLPFACQAAADHFADWPEGTSPRLIGTRLTKRFIADLKRKPGGGVKREIHYQEIITWYGSLTFAKVSGHKELTKELLERMDPMVRQETHVIPPPDHVDRIVLGSSSTPTASSASRAAGHSCLGSPASCPDATAPSPSAKTSTSAITTASAPGPLPAADWCLCPKEGS